ncbi:MAG TPA: KilA-N domain-containing protein [Nostoc sp.]|uniref:KilA-N domain-containing protein n=1 Tax=Nostoc sp. TaxID=1180 RepID=UPI002D362495|nr:KilA-N domain-containing protein [Nostoc sp.]HYX19180.1 KilA-N domain-containing protein [Nostoc sp.]
MVKNQKLSRDVNGIAVEQRVVDGFINATAMAVAHGKDISEWLALEMILRLVTALAKKLGVDPIPGKVGNSVYTRVSATYPTIVIVKRGSPENGGGTWVHPKLAVHVGQWCSEEFALQVSDWIEEWMTTGKNPIWLESDLDRVIYRDALKDETRLRMTDQIKVYLIQIKKYDDKIYRGRFFSKINDGINISVTSETAKQMRFRLSQMLGKEIKENELIRNYFPALYLIRYISVCEALANFMVRDGLHPETALERAIEIALPSNYIPRQIDFVEHINFVRQRLSQPVLGQENLKFLP